MLQSKRRNSLQIPPCSDSHRCAPGILVVDDEDMICALLELFFRQRGLAVWLAHNGEEAIEIYRLHSDEIGILLLDLHMPGLPGPQTFTKLRELNPELPCYFMSGYCFPYTHEQLLQRGALGVLAKPFRLVQLEQIAEMLVPSP